MGVAVMPFVGGDNLADFFVIDVIFGDILDLVHGPYWFGGEMFAKIFVHESIG